MIKPIVHCYFLWVGGVLCFTILVFWKIYGTVLQRGNCPRQTHLPRHSLGRAASTLTKNRLNRNLVSPAAASELICLARRDGGRQAVPRLEYTVYRNWSKLYRELYLLTVFLQLRRDESPSQYFLIAVSWPRSCVLASLSSVLRVHSARIMCTPNEALLKLYHRIFPNISYSKYVFFPVCFLHFS